MVSPASEEPRPADNVDVATWQQALDDVDRSLREALRAIGQLRRGLEGAERPASATQQGIEKAASVLEAALDGGGRSTFERLWDRIEHEKLEKQSESAQEPGTERRGLDLLPHQYLMTVEDRESKVDLVPLHRALLGLVPVENIALVSFANGVPVISMRSEGELDLDQLGEAVSVAMDRQCEVISQDSGRLYLRLRSWQDQKD